MDTPRILTTAATAAATLLTALAGGADAQDVGFGSPERVADSGLDSAVSTAALVYRLDAAGQAHAPQTPGDADLGDQVVLLPSAVYEPFTLLTNFEGLYTSNAGLSEANELDDFIYRARVGGAYVPHLVGSLYGQFNATYEFFRYDEHSRFDFDNLEATAGLVHVFRKLNDLAVWGRYEFNRITSGHGHDELFVDHGLELGIFLPLSLTAYQNLYLSQTSQFSLDADPDFSRFHQYNFTVGHELRATDELSLRTYYQLSVLDYNNAGRTDLLSTLGLTLRYDFSQNVGILVAGTYAINDSDAEGGDYEVGTAGCNLALTVRF